MFNMCTALIMRPGTSSLKMRWDAREIMGSRLCYVVIAGHARLAAAKKLRMTEVPVIVLGHLTEAQRRALVIADNQLALNAGWDTDLLRVALRALAAEDFDVDSLGFGESGLA